MADPAFDANQNVFDHPSRILGAGRSASGGGGGPTDRMMERIDALEEGFKELRASLKEIRDAQHKGDLDAERRSGDLNTRLADMNGEMKALKEVSTGLRRDVDKLPSKFDVAKVMVFVIGGFSALFGLARLFWPAIQRAITP